MRGLLRVALALGLLSCVLATGCLRPNAGDAPADSTVDEQPIVVEEPPLATQPPDTDSGTSAAAEEPQAATPAPATP